MNKNLSKFIEEHEVTNFKSRRISWVRQNLADHFSLKKSELIKRVLLGNLGFIGKKTTISPGFRFSRGYNIYIGDKVFINYNCSFQDSSEILIDDFSLIAPDVKVYTSSHDKTTRKRYSLPVYIGKRCWIGGGSIILPGTEIGYNSIVGAGSLVNKNIESNTIYAGNPIRKIGEVRRK